MCLVVHICYMYQYVVNVLKYVINLSYTVDNVKIPLASDCPNLYFILTQAMFKSMYQVASVLLTFEG